MIEGINKKLKTVITYVQDEHQLEANFVDSLE
jgi:hypothetical protein